MPSWQRFTTVALNLSLVGPVQFVGASTAVAFCAMTAPLGALFAAAFAVLQRAGINPLGNVHCLQDSVEWTFESEP